MTGIYFLIHKKRVVYIGQSKKLPGRIAGHGDKIFDSVRIIECSKDKLHDYECRLIRLFRPKHNKNSKEKFKLKRDIDPNGKAVQMKFDKHEFTMLDQMCGKNHRSPANQMIFAMKQQYYRQFDQSKLSQAF